MMTQQSILLPLACAVGAIASATAQQRQPLPPVPAPAQNPITAQKAVLGKILFWDEQLSSDNRMACGTCHMPETGGTDLTFARHPGLDGRFNTADDTFGSLGVRRADGQNQYSSHGLFGFARQVTPRKAPTAIASAYFDELFWDGRATTRFDDPLTGQVLIPAGGALENQAVGPVFSDSEMAHDARNWLEITAKLGQVRPLALATNLPGDVSTALATASSYGALFQAAFGDAAITPARIAYAIATYQRTLVPNQSPFDQWLAGNNAALTPQQDMGRRLFFSNQTDCGTCHTAPLMSDASFRFIGLRPAVQDEGRFAITGNPQHRGQFKVPTLRNVALNRTFMHTGEFQTLQQVVDFYNQPPPPMPGRDPLIRPLGLNPGQRQALEAFMRALTDPRVAARTGPFSRPTLHSELAAVGSNQFGTATFGSAGSPQMISEGASALGVPDFRVGMSGGPAGAMALFGLSTGESIPATMVLGVPVYIDYAASLMYPVTLNSDGGGTFTVPIPNAPVLAGLRFAGQWFVPDPALNYVASRGARWTLF